MLRVPDDAIIFYSDVCGLALVDQVDFEDFYLTQLSDQNSDFVF